MTCVLALCGWIVAGPAGLVWIGILGLAGLIGSTQISGPLVLRMFAAEPLPRPEMGEIYETAARLSHRAGLEQPPKLFYISSPTLNALTVGSQKDASIALTSGLLRSLTLRELTGVLGHEIAHIRHNDMWVMGLADMISRLTRAMSMAGLFLLIFNLPLMVTGGGQVPWLLVALLVFAPHLGTFLQLALSRARELDADLGAAEVTQDPLALALALRKLDRYQARAWEDIFLPGRRSPDPSVLRSHPDTQSRIRKLVAMSEAGREDDGAEGPQGIPIAHSIIPETPQRPRWRRTGLWY